MKRKLCIFLCILIGLGVATPMFYQSVNLLNAAETERNPEDEFIIDMEISAEEYPYTSSSAWLGYAITKDHNLYYNNSAITTGQYYQLVMDKNKKPLDKVVQVSANTYDKKAEFIALRTDGNIYVTGVNNGKFGNGENSGTFYSDPVLVDTGVSDVIKVISGYKTNYLLTKNGELYAAGDNSQGQFGNGNTESSNTFVKIADDVKDIDIGLPYTVYALKKDGSVYGWGGSFFNGINMLYDQTSPTPIYGEDKNPLSKVSVIDAKIVSGGPMLAVAVLEGDVLNVWGVGKNLKYSAFPIIVDLAGITDISEIEIERGGPTATGYYNNLYFRDGNKVYRNTSVVTGDTEIVKKINTFGPNLMWLSEDGYQHISEGVNGRIPIQRPLKITAIKQDKSSYESEEKYNDSISINTFSTDSSAMTCQVEDPVGNTAVACTDFIDNSIDIPIQENQRIYRKYIINNDVATEEFIVDLYKGTPSLTGYSTTSTNKIKVTDTISLDVPTDQKDWNNYTAKITDSSDNTTDYTGGTLKEGKYTLTVTDSYGNTQNYTFEVTDKPKPTAVFTPNSTSFVYKDTYTVANGIIGTLALTYPDGEPTSNIASISVSGTDASKFSIDNTGTLKVKGSNLNVGTYNITISGKDGNNMAFSEDVSVVVGKANQDNYKITNSANYPFVANQKITITTSGKESTGSETFRVTSGNAASISGNQFQILSSGTFTLEATVSGDANYNSKTTSLEITISELPTQNPAIHISSADTMMYGDTYTPSYSGGQGSGKVTWTIENDNATGAVLSNGSIKVTGVGTFTLKVEKAGDSTVQSSSETKIITVERRKTTVKPKNVTKLVGEAFQGNGVTYHPQPLSGDTIGTAIITSKYPSNQAAGMYTDGVQASGLSNPNYEFIYEDGTLIINSNALPNNGSGYYKIEGTKGKNNWYISDVLISATGKDGYDEISSDGVTFQSQALTFSADGDYPVDIYLKNSTTGIVAKAIRVQLKVDQTAPSIPTLTMREINTSRFAEFINALSFGNWMKQGAEVTMLSSDATSGIDLYQYQEISASGSNTKTSTSGIVTYYKDTEIRIQAKACDKAGNCSEFSQDESLMIDTMAPVISGVKDQSVYKHYYLPRYINVKDNGSGLSYAEYTRDGVMAGTITEGTDERIDDIGSYTIKAIDNAGNEGNLSFQIIPLPDIDDIDGSDESKDIIDQVKDEYEEIKNKLDPTERDDYEQWIKDAEDKWNDSRKKVVETDDKSAKVEGQDDTSFDPITELIVDEISEDDVPPLPKKALAVYDVYLRRGTTRVQPDGRIKVYLPYTEASLPDGDNMGGALGSAEPIVYQIDTNQKVTQISCQKEGDFVTFITDHLVKYAISDKTMEDNENDRCVVGKDDILNTGDDVCGIGNDKGDEPQKQPDGSVKVPDGGQVEFPNGNVIDTPDGAIIHPDGSVTLPDGTEYDPDGNIKDKDQNQCKLEGKDVNVDTDGDGLPDLNIDLNHDCIADLNIDTNFDNIPDVDIDTDGDGKADINVDKNHDGKPDLNIAIIKRWVPNKDCIYQGFAYDTGEGFDPYLNVDDDGDGEADRNIDDNGDGIPDRNVDDDWFDKYGDLVKPYNPNQNTGGALTGDHTKWIVWCILMILSGSTMLYGQYQKRKHS